MKYKKLIPLKYDYDPIKILDAVAVVFGEIPRSIDSKGFLTIEKSTPPTGAQFTALKQAIIPLLTEVSDVTV